MSTTVRNLLDADRFVPYHCLIVKLTHTTRAGAELDAASVMEGLHAFAGRTSGSARGLLDPLFSAAKPAAGREAGPVDRHE